jgi:MFS-type transporter involved in bile tolerance (Atg22 family)
MTDSASINLSDPRIIICGVVVIVATVIDLFWLKRHLFRWLMWSAVAIPLIFIIAPIPDQYDPLPSIAGRVAFGAVAAGVFALRAVVNDALRGMLDGGAKRD